MSIAAARVVPCELFINQDLAHPRTAHISTDLPARLLTGDYHPEFTTGFNGEYASFWAFYPCADYAGF